MGSFFSKQHSWARTTGLYLLAGVFCAVTRCHGVSITGFSPATAAPGQIVTISGSGFSTTTYSNVVYFGAVRGSVLADPAPTTTSLAVAVPIGATYAPLTVTMGRLVATAGQSFQPTFAVNSNNISSSTFASRVDFAGSSGPIFTKLGDLDNDGKPDVIVNNAYSHSFSLFRNISSSGVIGSGSFASPFDFSVGGTSDSPWGLTIADVDGDGKLDVLSCDRNSNQIAIYRNTATSGAFSSSTLATKVNVTTGSDPRHVAVADLNGDGKPDLVSVNYSGNSISLLQNNGSPGTISFLSKQDLATLPSGHDLGIMDLDGDGQLDIALVTYSNVCVFRNLGLGGTLTSSSFGSRVDLPGSAFHTAGMTIGDLTGDGKPELITTTYLGQTVSVFENLSSSGSLTTSSFGTHVDFSPGCRGHTLALSDLNGDQKADIGFVGELSSKMSVYQNLNTGGTFTTSSLASRVDYSTLWNAWGISAGDVDSDGRPDIIFCNAYDTTMSVYRNALPWTADLYVGLEGVSNGVLTDSAHNSAMNNGTHGVFDEWALEQTHSTFPQHGNNFAFVSHGAALHSPVTVDGTTYNPSTSTHAIALDLSTNYSWLTCWFLPASGERTKQLTVSGFVTFGPAQNSNRQLFDTISISDTSGNGFVMQLQNGVGSAYALNIECNVPGNTKHSEEIPISRNTTYWCCLRGDFVNGAGQLAVYETSTWKLVGSVSIKEFATGNDVMFVRIGNAEVGTSPGDFTYFENLCFDAANAAFPFGL